MACSILMSTTARWVESDRMLNGRPGAVCSHRPLVFMCLAFFAVPLLVTDSDEKGIASCSQSAGRVPGAVIAMLLIIGMVAYRSVLASFESAQWTQHTDEVLEHLANLRLRMENIENGYRDFALSGTSALSSNARAPMHRWLTTNKEPLRALTVDNPRQQGRLRIVADLLQRMIDPKRADAIEESRRQPPADDTAALIQERVPPPTTIPF